MPNVWGGHKSTHKLNKADIAGIVSSQASNRIVCSTYLDLYGNRPMVQSVTPATIMCVIYVRVGIPAFVCITGSEHSVSFHLSQEQLGKKS